MIENLFSTPVATYDLKPLFGDFESSTEAMIGAFPRRSFDTNMFNFPPEFSELEQIMKDIFRMYSLESGLMEELIHFNALFNEHTQGQLNTPHSHPFCTAIAVYYLRAEPGNGDILLHDPRGSVLWRNRTDVDSRGKGSFRAFKRITPESGQLLLFPAYVIHSVEPNQLETTRLSVAMNLFNRDFLRRFNPKI